MNTLQNSWIKSKGDPHIGQLASSEPLLGYLADESISFLEKTQQLADKLFALIAPAEEIGPADYGYSLQEQAIQAALSLWNDSPRLQFKKSLTLSITKAKPLAIRFLQNHAYFAKRDAKPSEAFIADLSNGNYHLIEKSSD